MAAAALALALGAPAPASARPARPSPPAAAPPPAPAAASTGPAGAPTAGPAGAAALPTALAPDPNAQGSSLGGAGPLVANGLGSPSCRDPTLRAQLSGTARADCATSGVAVAAAPLENYQFDVHIDAGFLGQTGDTLIQNLVLKPAWMALVWLTHVAVVALEWCFSLDLLGAGTLGSVTRGVQSMRDALTTPWLAPVLAIAAVAVLYNGIVRRRVVDTVGQFALLLAMMAGGLWVIADPRGTVGEASRLANQASLGVLGAAATGDPSRPLGGLDDALRPLFDVSVTGPWCYLEFGNVAWCREPTRLDPHLVAAAGAVLARDQADASSPAQHRQVQVEATEIARARTNGELFLALPSNGPRRNSINADAANPSLLRVLCGTDTATSCSAATAPQAEFRTQKGTGARIGGLLLIGIGALGMFALVGFICLRLLGAALLALLYLLLAPVAVLAPALGDGGRDAFRRWSLRLLGAVLAKLVYSVFLGVVLLMVRILSGLGSLGWWTQWVLIAGFWWLVFTHRHRVLENVIHERAEPTRRASLANRLFATRQTVKLAGPPSRRLAGAVRRRAEQLQHLPDRALELPRRRRATNSGAGRAEQVARTLERDHETAAAMLARAPATELEIGDLRARRDRLAQERHATMGDRRRSVSLERRQRDVQAQIDAGERELAAARTAVPAGEERRRQTGVVHDLDQRARRSELLDREAELRPLLAAASDRRVGRRDYAGLAGLAGLARRDYERLAGAERRRAQLEIDRELERRRAWSRSQRRATELADRARRRSAATKATDPRPQRRPQSRRQRQFDASGRHAATDRRPSERPLVHLIRPDRDPPPRDRGRRDPDAPRRDRDRPDRRDRRDPDAPRRDRDRAPRDRAARGR